MESPHKCRVNSGFTLVELSIVMIIIGLLIGGIFGGMKLIDNANVQKTVQDLKSIDSATLTFKDIYRALPGDIRNPSLKLQNCSDVPCSRSGDGNRIIGTSNTWMQAEALTLTSEKFTFWSHLFAADLISNVKNVDDMNFGEGQPECAVGGGYRMNSYVTGSAALTSLNNHTLYITGVPSALVDTSDATIAAQHWAVSCAITKALDNKLDDGKPRYGKLLTNGYCLANIADETSDYANPSSTTSIFYRLAF